MAKKRPIITASVEDLVSEAFGEIESLKDELQEWRDSIPLTLQDGDKASQLDDAISSLESHEAPDVPASAGDLTGTYTKTPGRLSRSNRRYEACAMAGAACDAVRARIEELSEIEYDEDGKRKGAGDGEAHATEEERDSDVSDLETLADALEEATGEWENVEFPGMFG